MVILNLALAVVGRRWLRNGTHRPRPWAWAWVGSAGFLRIIDWDWRGLLGHEFGSGHRIEAIYDRIA
jgi:hypothetical protein